MAFKDVSRVACGIVKEISVMIPGILSGLRVAGCVSPTLSLVDVSAARQSGSQNYRNHVLELPLSPEVFRGKLKDGERGESTSLPDRNKDPVQRLGKKAIGPGDTSREQRRKTECGTCHTRR